MKNYVYHNKNFRCKVKACDGTFEDFRLQLQERWLILFWFNIGDFLALKEGKWLIDNAPGFPNPSVSDYGFGGKHESWSTGTLNVKKRALQMIKDHFINRNHARIRNEKRKSVIDKL